MDATGFVTIVAASAVVLVVVVGGAVVVVTAVDGPGFVLTVVGSTGVATIVRISLAVFADWALRVAGRGA